MNVSETSPAARQILDILAELQTTLGEDFTKLDADEIVKIRAIVRHSETLVAIAEYEEARGLIWAHWRSLILGASALVLALVTLWANFEKVARALGKVLQ